MVLHSHNINYCDTLFRGKIYKWRIVTSDTQLVHRHMPAVTWARYFLIFNNDQVCKSFCFIEDQIKKSLNTVRAGLTIRASRNIAVLHLYHSGFIGVRVATHVATCARSRADAEAIPISRIN